MSASPRSAEIVRTTRETDIRLKLDLDGQGRAEVATGLGFLDHMLDLFARHSLVDLAVACTGDLYVGLGMVNVPRSMHPGGVDVGMADGAVRLIKNSVNVATFQALSSAGGSETVSSDSY